MKLYITQTCPMVPSTLTILRSLQLDFATVDIDVDSNAREQLRQLTGGNLSVPTLYINDTEVLIEPTSAELMARFGRGGIVETPAPNTSINRTRYSERISAWLKIILTLVLGLTAFEIGYQVLPAFVSTSSVLPIGGGIGAVIFNVLAQRSPRFRKPMSSPWGKLIFLLLYSALMGVGLKNNGQSDLANPWMALFLLGCCAGVLVILGSRLRTLYQLIRKAQRVMGIITLMGFSGLLLVGLAAPRGITPTLVLPVIFSAGMLLLTSCLQLSQAEKPRIDQAQRVVFTSIALLIAVSLMH